MVNTVPTVTDQASVVSYTCFVDYMCFINEEWENTWVASKWVSSRTDSNPYLTVYTWLLINTYSVCGLVTWNG